MLVAYIALSIKHGTSVCLSNQSVHSKSLTRGQRATLPNVASIHFDQASESSYNQQATSWPQLYWLVTGESEGAEGLLSPQLSFYPSHLSSFVLVLALHTKAKIVAKCTKINYLQGQNTSNFGMDIAPHHPILHWECEHWTPGRLFDDNDHMTRWLN